MGSVPIKGSAQDILSVTAFLLQANNMPRLSIFSKESAPEASRPLIDKVQTNNGFVPNLIGVLAGSPQALETYLGVGATNAKASLSFAEREVVQLTAARIHGCGFCVAGHTAAVVKNQLFDHEDVLALQYGEPLANTKLQAIADFTEQIIATRGAMPDASLQTFLKAGYSEQQAIDVVLGISLATLCNFVNNLARTEINPELQDYAIGGAGENSAHPASATLTHGMVSVEKSLAWLPAVAESLDQSTQHTDLLERIAADGLTRIGVPESLGGSGGAISDAVESIASLAEHSLTASFVLWSQRCYTEFVVKSNNERLRERELPALLSGQWAGAPGLSNAMKFLGGIESLEIVAQPDPDSLEDKPRWYIDGMLPWVTNLHSSGFSVAAAAKSATSASMPVFALRSTLQGVERSDNLELIALRGSDVAAVQLDNVVVDQDDQLHEDLNAWLPQIRPQFLSFLCGMSIGVGRASIAAAWQQAGHRPGLKPKIEELSRAFQTDVGALKKGLETGRFVSEPAALFRLRIAFARHVREALHLELQAWGGRAYLKQQAPGFARRWRESAFIPVITPSLVQLELQLGGGGVQPATP